MNSEKILTPVKAIRAKCLNCMCFQQAEVRRCPMTDCALYPYRLGKNPNRKRKTDENAVLDEEDEEDINEDAET